MSEKCKWGMYSRFDDGVLGTSCGAEWEFTDGGTIEEHGMKFCPFCGRAIEEVPNQHNLSAFERQIIQHLPEEVEWISRNQDGGLNIHAHEPEYKFYGVWMSDRGYELPLKNLFKHVKWEVPWNFREEDE